MSGFLFAKVHKSNNFFSVQIMVCLSFFYICIVVVLKGVCYNVHFFHVFCFYVRCIFILFILYAIFYLLPVFICFEVGYMNY